MDTYWHLITGALGLDPAAFRAIESADHGLRQALVILLLAGASETLGQSVVLVLNRVSRGRFFLALLLGGAELVLEGLVWIFSVWVLGGWLGATRPPFFSAVRVIGLAYAPLVLGVFIFFPYIGPLIGRLLRLWVLLAAVVGISVVFGVAPWMAALIAAAGLPGPLGAAARLRRRRQRRWPLVLAGQHRPGRTAALERPAADARVTGSQRMILDLLFTLIGVALVGVLVIGLLAPVESLRWWAGFSGEEESAPASEAASAADGTQLPGPTRWSSTCPGLAASRATSSWRRKPVFSTCSRRSFRAP